MKNMFFLFTAVLGLSFSSTAVAEEGFYAGIIGGANWLSRQDSRSDHQAGYLIGFDLGYSMCNNFSFEGEFVYRRNHLKHNFDLSGSEGYSCEDEMTGSTAAVDTIATGADYATGVSSGRGHGKGHVRGYSAMANIRYDWAIDCCFTPYIRGGLGWAETKIEKNHNGGSDSYANGTAAVVGSENNYGSNSNTTRERRRGFAYQVGVGLAFPVCDNITMDVGYNFLRALKEVNNQSLVFAARYTF